MLDASNWFKFITFQKDLCIYQIDAIIHSLRISFPFCILTCVIHLILFLMDNGFVSSRFIQIYIYIQVFRWKKSHYHLEYMFLKMDTCICIQNFCSTQGRSQWWWCYHCISFCYVQYDNRCKLMERHRRVILAPKQGHHQMMIGQCQFSTLELLNRLSWKCIALSN